MKKFLIRNLTLTVLAVLITAAAVSAGRNDPITGEQFDYWLRQQHSRMQAKLMELCPESEGYLVLGPLCDPALADDTTNIGSPLRLIAPDLSYLENVIKAIRNDSMVMEDFTGKWRRPVIEQAAKGRVVTFTVKFSNEEPVFVRFETPQQDRFAIWLAAQPSPFTEETQFYAREVSNYLNAVAIGDSAAKAPEAAGFRLPQTADFYAKPPPYTIDGYQNYLDFLYRHAAINTDFARGVTAFIPSDSLLATLRANAPRAAFPNKEWPMYQRECRKFYERGGDPNVLQTLTREGFDTLKAGEYFFAVGLTGRIRFGRELLRAEVERIENEWGHKVPRANHAFLLPGELILTAGAFIIEDSPEGPRLAKVNAQSGHYFYSNLSKTIREDIEKNSDRYLLTLGHFLISLDSLGIPYDDVLISKL